MNICMDTGIDSLQQLKKFYDEILKFFKFQKTPKCKTTHPNFIAGLNHAEQICQK